MDTYSFEHTQAAGTFVIKSDGGQLHSITVNTTANGAVTVYDNTSAAGKVIAVIKASVAEGSFIYDLNFINGLTIVAAAASDLTISFT